MARVVSHDLQKLRRAADSRWITATVAALAIVVFTISGSEILPAIVSSSNTGGRVSDSQVAAFLLNIALLLFAWRRSKQLMETFKERDAAELRASELAYVDEVTGLHNRRYLKDIFASHHAQPGKKSALLLMDLDRFKGINDLHGHEIGDELLVAAAQRILKVCPKETICARLGGDEFAILFLDHPKRKSELETLAVRLIKEFSQPFHLSDNRLVVGASIGLMSHRARERDLSGLLRGADIAMYEAKRSGGNNYVEFDAKMEEALSRRKALEGEINGGITAREFVPYFQPIFELGTRNIQGFEVLARWHHPSRGILEPCEFLDVAEASGLINELSFAVMRQALNTASQWPGSLRLAVNISPIQFRDSFLAQRIIRLLEESGFPAERLDLEVAESSLIADRAFALSTIQILRQQGIEIVVDDFATGYASLAQMQALPFDRLKIDKSFLEMLDEGNKCDAIVQAIAALGKGLCIPVSAEGVETEKLRDKLIEIGCGNAQGWLYSKALSSAQVDGIFRGHEYSLQRAEDGPDAVAQAS